MTAGSTLAILPGSKPEQRVEVVLGQRPDGELSFELREQHYAEGIGWFDQRTLVLEPAQIRRLRQVLGNGTPLDRIVEESTSKAPATLPFPTPAGKKTRRLAAGDRA